MTVVVMVLFFVVVIGFFSFVIWQLYSGTVAPTKAAKQAKEEELRKKAAFEAGLLEHRAVLLDQIAQLNCTLHDLIKTHFSTYKEAIINKIANEGITYKWFDETEIKLYTFTAGLDYLNADFRQDKLEPIYRTILHTTWWPCSLESLKERLIELAEQVTEPITLDQLIIQVFIGTTYSGIVRVVANMLNTYSREEEDEYYAYIHEHPEAYQLARQVDAINVQTEAIHSYKEDQKRTFTAQSRAINNKLDELERKQNSIAATAEFAVLQNCFRRY